MLALLLKGASACADPTSSIRTCSVTSCRRRACGPTRRPSIPSEQLLRALLLQYLYTIRSKRLLMEEIDYSVLFRWFIGLGMDDPIWSPTTFSKNRDRPLKSDIAAAFLDAVLGQARAADLLSDEHFTVNGTLLESWASLKSFRRKDDQTTPPDDPGNPTVNFHGESGRNDTHQSTTDRSQKEQTLS
jgi:transposase